MWYPNFFQSFFVFDSLRVLNISYKTKLYAPQVVVEHFVVNVFSFSYKKNKENIFNDI